LPFPLPKLQLTTFTAHLSFSLNHAVARELEVYRVCLAIDGLCISWGKMIKGSHEPSRSYRRQGKRRHQQGLMCDSFIISLRSNQGKKIKMSAQLCVDRVAIS